MNRPPKRILYLRPGKGKIPLNERTVGLLQEQFPDHEVVVGDVRKIVQGARLVFAANLAVTAWEYCRDLVTKRKRFWHCFWRTSFIFNRTRSLIRREFGDRGWSFTFQIQSLFDGSMDGVPHFVYTDHTHLANLSYPGFQPSNLFSRAWISCEREIYHRATAVFTMSTNMRSSLIEDYGVEPDKISCVYSGPNIQIEDNISVNDETGPLEILFVGVDWHRKGGDLLVDAYSRIASQFPQTEVVIVGCERPAEVLPEGIRFIGRVPLDQVGEYFQRASIFCMPTRLEPFGIVFIEAMAYSLPIVATRIGAIPDLVDDGKNGLLVDSGDTEGLARALRKLLEDPRIRKEMGHNGRRRYLERFNWTTVYARMRQHMAAQVHLQNAP